MSRTPNALQTAELFLSRDALIGTLVKKIGRCTLVPEKDLWLALSSSIISQQISVAAARTIRGRFAALENGKNYTSPAFVASAAPELIRSAGVSSGKVLSLKSLAAHVLNGNLSHAALDSMTNEEVIEALLPIRGIGRWTAEMFLIFSLGRMDVMSLQDVGLQRAFCKLLGTKIISSKKMLKVSTQWQPWRSVAAWYLWRSLEE